MNNQERSDFHADVRDYVPLSSPLPITQHNWPGGPRPLVSICCIAFNHKNFIGQALESFLMQETTFPVEIYIHDDASTDGTTQIIREYQAKYPQLIRSILQSENQYTKEGNTTVSNFLLSARGEYIAFCEGDDFWTAANKLELQVAYLKAHPNVAISFHDVIRVNEQGERISPSKIKDLVGSNQPLKLRNYVDMAQALIPAVSAVFRNVPIKYGPRSRSLVILDVYRHARLSEYGEAHNIGITMAAHRVHSGGIWTSKSYAKQLAGIRQLRAAVAWEIAPPCCLGACAVLARHSIIQAGIELSQWRISAVAECVFYYLSSFVICFRAPKKNMGDIGRIFRTSMGIILIPARHFKGFLQRSLVQDKKRTS